MSMTLATPAIRDSGVSVTFNAQAFFSQAWNTIKTKVIAIWQTFAAFAQNTALPFVKNLAGQAWTFIRTPAGFITVGGVLGLTLGALSARINHEEQPFLKAMLQVAAVAAFVGTGIVVGIGLSRGFLVTLV